MKTKNALLILAALLASCGTFGPKTNKLFNVDYRAPNAEIGEVGFQISQIFPLTGIRKVDAKVYYYPFEDAVCVYYKGDFYNYYQFWHAGAREKFVRELALYNEEYSERAISPDDKNSKQRYGTAENCYITWHEFSFTDRFSANTNFRYGYAFSGVNPYYTVVQERTVYEDAIDKSRNRPSQEVTLFFTRAQAAALAELFDREFLMDSVPEDIRASVLRAQSRAEEPETEPDAW